MTRLELDEDWKIILRDAWSVRFTIIAGFFGGLEAALPFLYSAWHGPAVALGAMTFFATAGALISRVVVQRKMQDRMQAAMAARSTDGAAT